jgi:hypothetical protein
VAAITCPNPACGSIKFVSEAAVEAQLEEDESYQCSSCGHRWDPYQDPEEAKRDTSAAEPNTEGWLKARKK